MTTKKTTKKKIRKDDTSHYYIDGFVSGTGTLGLVGYPNAFKGTDTDRGVVGSVDAVDISLESMDGRSHQDIYAVGLGGEIWHFDGRHWDQIDSPTNEHLFEVSCVSPDLTYAVGNGGVVVRGNGTHW